MTVNELGTFTFNSLADLEAGRPASFIAPALAEDAERPARTSAASSLGDSYRPTDDLQMQYGVRVDGNRFNQRRRSMPTSSSVRRAQRPRAEQRLSQPAHRLLVDVRHGIAGRRLPGRGARSARGGARRHRRVPEHAERAGDRRRDRQHRSAVGVQQLTASAPRRRRRTGRRTRATPAIPDRVRRRHDRHRVREHGAERSAVRQELSGAAVASLEPPVERRDPRQSVRDDDRRDVLAEPESGEHVRSELQPDDAVRAGGRRQSSGLRAVRRASSPTTGGIAATEARVATAFSHVSELRSDMQSEAKQLTLSLRPLSFSSRCSWSASYVLREHARAVSRLHEHRRQSARRRVGTVGFDSRHQIMYSPDLQRVRLHPPRLVSVVPVRACRTRRPSPATSTATATPTIARSSSIRPRRATPRSRRACGRCSRTARARRASVSTKPARHGRGAQQLPGTVDDDGGPELLVQPGEGAHAAARDPVVPALESARRGGLLLHGENKLHGWGQTVRADEPACSSCAASIQTTQRSSTRSTSASARRPFSRARSARRSR